MASAKAFFAPFAGVLVCALIAGIAYLVQIGTASAGVTLPWLTIAVVLGLLVGQTPFARTGALQAGIGFSGKTLMRAGIVLLGLQLSFGAIAALGVSTLVAVVALVAIGFGATYAFARIVGLPGSQPVLMAAGFSICGASAIGAVAPAIGAKPEEQGAPVALVTLFGTVMIAVLPFAAQAFGLSDAAFGVWAGASVHDVGQVVATASTAGSAALAAAVVVKLTRVLCLAPMTAIVAWRSRRSGASRPQIVPLFVIGFIVAIAIRTWLPVPHRWFDAAELLQHALLAVALVGLMLKVRLRALVREAPRALGVAAASTAVLAFGGLALATLAG